MISHSIVVKEVKTYSYGSWKPSEGPRIFCQEELDRYLDTLEFKPGDFLTYGPPPIHTINQVLLVCDWERVFAYMTFINYNNSPKVLKVFSLAAVTATTNNAMPRWDSVDSFRKVNAGEIKTHILPLYDQLLHRCEKHCGPEAIEALKTYRAF